MYDVLLLSNIAWELLFNSNSSCRDNLQNGKDFHFRLEALKGETSFYKRKTF